MRVLILITISQCLFTNFRTSGESARLVEIGIDLLDDTGAVINAWPFRAGAYNDRTGLMSELRRDGMDL